MPAESIATGDLVFNIVANNLTAAGVSSARATMTIGATAIANATNSRLMTISNTVKGVEESFRRLGNTLVGAGGALTGTFTLPLLLGIKSLTTAGTEFETELYRVASLFTDAQHPVETLTKDLKDFAQATAIKSQFTGAEVLQTMYIMGQAGYMLKDVYSATNPILELATAQQYDLAQTFAIVNSVLKSYNLTSEDSEKIVNMLAAAATQFNLSMDDLQNGLKYILPTAKSLDMELSEMLVILGALTDRGFKGQQAGRILRDSFSDLIAPVGKSSTILEKYNLTLYTNQEAINGAARAYNAARQQLEYMERGTLGSKTELAELSAEIDKNNILISQAKTSGQINEIEKLTAANTTLKNTYSLLSGQQRINSAQIAEYRQYVDDLGVEMDKVTVEGLVPFHKVIEEIAESGMTAGEIYDVFGKQSGGAIIALTDIYRNNTDYFNQMMDIVETKLAAQEQAAVQMESTAFQSKKLQEALSQLRYEGYEALAPVIREINDWVLLNHESLKMFMRMLIEGMLPSLRKFLGMIQGVIDWFKNLGEGTQRAIIGITTISAVFLAAIGPILLYVGALAWGIASLIGLGRRGFDTALIMYNLAKAINTVGVMNLLTNSTIGKLVQGLLTSSGVIAANAAVATTSAGEVTIAYTTATGAMTQSAYAANLAAQGYATTGTAAVGAAGGVSTLGSSIMTILPYLALVAAALYVFYYAWKNNWFGLRDFTDTIIKDIKNIIANSNLEKDFENINKDVANQVSGLFMMIEGIVEADGGKITGGIGKMIGSWLRKIVDSAMLFYDAGKMLWDFFMMGITRQKTPEDITRGMTEMFAERMAREEKQVSEYTKQFIEGFTRGDYTVTALGELKKTNQKIEEERERSFKANATLLKKQYDQNMTYYEMVDGGIRFNTNYNPFAGIKSPAALEDVNSTINSMDNSTVNLNKTLEDGTITLDDLMEAYKLIPNGITDSFETNSTEIQDIMANALGDIDYASFGEDAGKEFLNAYEESAKINIDNLYELAGMSSLGQALGQSGVAGTAPTYYTSREAELSGLNRVGYNLYDRNTINKAVGEEKIYDGEIRNLIDIMSGYTPAGTYAPQMTIGAALPTVETMATTGAGYLTEAMAPSAAPTITNITNNNVFNINTNVYPKEEMNASEINKLGNEITAIVEQKLGEKYQSDEVI